MKTAFLLAILIKSLAAIPVSIASSSPSLKKYDAVLSASQFSGSVLRNLHVPSEIVDKIELEVNNMAVLLASPPAATLEKYKSVFDDQLDTTQQRQLTAFVKGNQYRDLIENVQELWAAIGQLLTLKFTQDNVDVVVNYLRTYNIMGSSSSSSHMSKPSWKREENAVSKFHKKQTHSSAQKAQARRRSLDVNVAVSVPTGAIESAAVQSVPSAITGAMTTVAGAPVVGAAAQTAVAESNGIFSKTLALATTIWTKVDKVFRMIDALPEPIKMILSKVMPPLGIIMHSIGLLDCVIDHNDGFTFHDFYKMGQLFLCSTNIISMLPVGSEIKMAAKFLISLVSLALKVSATGTINGGDLFGVVKITIG